MKACPRPAQIHTSQNSSTKKWAQSQIPNPKAIANGEGKISLLQWSDMGSINHTPGQA